MGLRRGEEEEPRAPSFDFLQPGGGEERGVGTRSWRGVERKAGLGLCPTRLSPARCWGDAPHFPASALRCVSGGGGGGSQQPQQPRPSQAAPVCLNPGLWDGEPSC